MRTKNSCPLPTAFARRLLSLTFASHPEKGIGDAIHFIEEVKGPDSSALNFLLTNGRELFAYRRAFKKWAEYTLYYIKKRDAVIVSSDPLTEEHWTIIPNGELLSVKESLNPHLQSM